MGDAVGVTAWLERHQWIPGGPFPGPYRFDTVPYLREVAEELFGGTGPRRVVLVAAAMMGKSELLAGLAAYAEAKADPTCLLVRCDATVADLRRRKLWSQVAVRTAMAPQALACRSFRCVLADEIDDFPPRDDPSGDPLLLLRQKTLTFSDGRELWASSPHGDASRVLRAYACTDQRRFFVPCPRCSEAQVLDFWQLRWAAAEPRSAVYSCCHCGHEINESSKAEMVSAGQWRATAFPQVKDSVGFHVSALYSPWTRWADLAREWERAGTDPLLRRVFQSLRLAEPQEAAEAA